jgi:hypothetical protein
MTRGDKKSDQTKSHIDSLLGRCVKSLRHQFFDVMLKPYFVMVYHWRHPNLEIMLEPIGVVPFNNRWTCGFRIILDIPKSQNSQLIARSKWSRRGIVEAGRGGKASGCREWEMPSGSTAQSEECVFLLRNTVSKFNCECALPAARDSLREEMSYRRLQRLVMALFRRNKEQLENQKRSGSVQEIQAIASDNVPVFSVEAAILEGNNC